MKFKFSTPAIGIVALACLLVDFSLKNWEKEERVIEWDVHSYYEYLPAFFTYDDIKFEKSDYRLSDSRYLFWPVFTDDGRKVIKMTMGTAFFYTPFFFAAHVYASVTDYPEDGFSEAYKIFLLLSTVFYLIIGFDFLRKILSRYDFSDKIIATVILLIGLGTNMLCYASQSAPMSHVYSFCAFTIFIYYTIRWYEKQSIKHTVILGLLFGLIALVRPTNSVIILFFILYGVLTFSELKKRLLFFLRKYLLVLVMAVCTFLVWIPQILYWKAATGQFFSYSYGDEGFFFSHPRILEGLFSWRKGWLVYTPMMAFSLAGIFFLKGELKKFRAAISVFMIVNVYIVFSWWCWWYGGTFGQRSFIESSGMLAIPFASFLKYLSDKKIIYGILFYGIGIFLIWLNIFQTYQFEFHALHYDGMSKKLYFKQFGKLDTIPDNEPLISWPNYKEAIKGNDCEARSADNAPAQINSLPSSTDKKELGRKTVQLKAYNGKFVCADETMNNLIIANRDSALGWETFTLVLFENNECALLSHLNKFFTVETGQEDELSATRNNICKMGTFLLEDLGNNTVAFKAGNGKYLSVNERTLSLFAKSDTPSTQEQFEMVVK